MNIFLQSVYSSPFSSPKQPHSWLFSLLPFSFLHFHELEEFVLFLFFFFSISFLYPSFDSHPLCLPEQSSCGMHSEPYQCDFYSSSMPLLKRSVLPATQLVSRSFATKFYDSPLFRSFQKEFEYSLDNEVPGTFSFSFLFWFVLDADKNLSNIAKQFRNLYFLIILSISRGWELDAQDGSCEITLMKPIAEDEHVMVTLRADTQEDMNYDEEVCISSWFNRFHP